MLDEQSIYNLNGEWIFHWEKLLTPENYETQLSTQGIPRSTVPSYWQNYEIDGQSLPGWGYGTYSLQDYSPGELSVGHLF